MRDDENNIYQTIASIITAKHVIRVGGDPLDRFSDNIQRRGQALKSYRSYVFRPYFGFRVFFNIFQNFRIFSTLAAPRLHATPIGSPGSGWIPIAGAASVCYRRTFAEDIKIRTTIADRSKCVIVVRHFSTARRSPLSSSARTRPRWK